VLPVNATPRAPRSWPPRDSPPSHAARSSNKGVDGTNIGQRSGTSPKLAAETSVERRMEDVAFAIPS
jgi:hypothetical protein